MTTITDNPDMWSEVALVTLCPKSTTGLGSSGNVEFAVPTTTIDIDEGDKDMDVTATLGAGRVVKYTPQAETTITFESYFIDVSTVADSPIVNSLGIEPFFNQTQSNWKTIEPAGGQGLWTTPTRFRQLFGLAILWCNDPTAISGAGAVSKGYQAKRFIATNCRIISCKSAFTDNELKTTWKLKVPPFTKNKLPNYVWHSNSGDTTTMGALSLSGTSLGAIGGFTTLPTL